MINFESIVDKKNLTQEVAERIADQIDSGAFDENHRLPTVEEFAIRFGVSRTVIRESVAVLKADGLIIVRHGSGMYADSDHRNRPLRFDSKKASNINDIKEIMQVRLALEVEAAGIAADRRSVIQLKKIEIAYKEIATAAKKEGMAVMEDKNFHRQISLATGNSYFSKLLDFLGHYVIPCGRIQGLSGGQIEERRYLKIIQKEHLAILIAIKDGDSQAARTAMQIHLRNGLIRVEQFEDREPQESGDPMSVPTL